MSERIITLKPGETIIIQSENICENKTYNVTETSKLLKCSRNKIYRLIKKGELITNSQENKITEESIITFKNKIQCQKN